jgi:sterol desaturase/sphingolipid hydroxylase (fatty acid hydroxylase superfamily)
MDRVFDWVVDGLMSPFFEGGEVPHQWSRVIDSIWAYLKGLILIFPCYVIMALALYMLAVLTRGRSGAARFSYPVKLDEPGDKLSFMGGLRYVLPPAIYRHPSFRIDMMWIPFSLSLRLMGLLTVTLGSATVLLWLGDNLGPSRLAVAPGDLSTVLQVIIMLVARDFSRFMWHYAAHKVPFFWAFHKVHHSAEVLHPFTVRTHPVDTFLRSLYMGGGGALIAGGLFYVLGIQYSIAAANTFAGIVGALHLIEHFEHTHVSFSFGRFMGKIFYAPHLHQFHHGASERHRSVNLGIAGGLTLWDRMFGTLYWPEDGEKIVWGASLDELNEKNPHRTIWGLFWTPFVDAFEALRMAVRDSRIT